MKYVKTFFPFRGFLPYTQTHAELLFMNLWGMSIWILIAYILYKKGMFLSIWELLIINKDGKKLDIYCPNIYVY